MTPIVSFIVTYHNEPEEFLTACLKSIRALPLSAEEAEIIVVDDGSNGLPSCLQGERLIRQKQAGLSVARNTGIEASCGRYIQFVDADDQLIPSAYEAVLGHLRKGDADVVLFKPTSREKTISNQDPSNYLHKGETSSISLQEGCGGSFPPTSGPDFLQSRNLRAAAWGYAFRRDVLDGLRFFPGLLHEDELFTPQLFLKAKTLVELDAKAYFYRQHADTITHTKSSDKVRKRLDDIHLVLRELQALQCSTLQRRIRQLTVDYLQKTWTLTRSPKELRRRIRELRQEGFLPLPPKRYSLRYFLFSLFV